MKIGTNVPPGTSKREANFQMKRSKVKVKNLSQLSGVVYLRAADQEQAAQVQTAN